MKVGEYIFTASGKLARITKINKTTYTYEELTSQWGSSDNVKFDGIKHYYGSSIEWFECTDAQAEALRLAMKRYKAGSHLEETKEEIEKLLGKAKSFLEQITDIEPVEVIEDDD